MPHKTTIKFDISVNSHSAKPSAPEVYVDAYMPISKKIEPNKDWQRIVIDGGERDSVSLFLISSKDDKYSDKTCPSKKPSLYFRFLKKEGMGKERKWNPDPPDGYHALTGPILFAGFTTSLLPATLDAIEVKNLLNEAVTIEILIAKTEKDATEDDACAPTPLPQMAVVARPA